MHTHDGSAITIKFDKKRDLGHHLSMILKFSMRHNTLSLKKKIETQTFLLNTAGKEGVCETQRQLK